MRLMIYLVLVMSLTWWPWNILLILVALGAAHKLRWPDFHACRT